MDSFSEIIDAFHGQFAEAIGIEESHARTMRARNSIPSTRWQATVDAAHRLQIQGVTLEVLARLEAAKIRSKESAQ
ncbi:hypothetical protein [Bradyrhizobium sp. Tv2a-2]|uniref:hypothetical protein n=1 Tax=Bradyrhizobium sp. Tv2a-2 TaxID=113395 RepID=UPI000417DB0E|nr:hypothetical protein [Bradyrhizobium sp. Tv2a-2]